MWKKLYVIFFYLTMGWIMASMFGCATSGKRKGRSLVIPPGLDSTTVIRANRLADNSFVTVRQEAEAKKEAKIGKANLGKVDKFWAYLENRIKKNKKLSQREKQQFARAYAQGEKALARWKELSKNNADEDARQEAYVYCTIAQEHLENAVRINPFNKNAKVLLAVSYYNLQHIFGQQQKYQKSVEILERLTRIEKGEHDLFRLLAENYLALNKYEQALLNFKKARSILIKTSFEAPPDTSLLFYYLYAQGDALTRMHEAAPAKKAFKAALLYARRPQEKTDITNYLEWINWDGGNIKASEEWDKIVALEAAKNYPKMAAACTDLLPLLKTRKARRKVNHKLSVVEFEFLGRQAQAVERMHSTFLVIPKEKRNKPDAETKPFLDAYGAMLYRLGVDSREQQQKKTSLAYFTKAASFKWDQVAKVYIELVTLLWNNPEEAIRYGKKALENRRGLSSKEAGDLLSLMVRAHKSAGLYDEARTYFEKWKQFRSKYATNDE